MNIGSALQLRQLLFAGALNQKTSEAVEMVRVFKVPNETGFIEEGKKKPKKNIDIELHGLWGRDVPSPLPVEHTTPSGWPGANTPMLRGLAGNQGAAKRLLREENWDLTEEEAKGHGLGTAFAAFGGGREGEGLRCHGRPLRCCRHRHPPEQLHHSPPGRCHQVL